MRKFGFSGLFLQATDENYHKKSKLNNTFVVAHLNAVIRQLGLVAKVNTETREKLDGVKIKLKERKLRNQNEGAAKKLIKILQNVI